MIGWTRGRRQACPAGVGTEGQSLPRTRPRRVDCVDGAHHTLGAVDAVDPVRQHPAAHKWGAWGGALEVGAKVIDERAEVGLEVGAVAGLVRGGGQPVVAGVLLAL